MVTAIGSALSFRLGLMLRRRCGRHCLGARCVDCACTDAAQTAAARCAELAVSLGSARFV